MFLFLFALFSAALSYVICSPALRLKLTIYAAGKVGVLLERYREKYPKQTKKPEIARGIPALTKTKSYYGRPKPVKPQDLKKAESFRDKTPYDPTKHVLLRSSSAPPPPWMPDESVQACIDCKTAFTLLRRRHHCRFCRRIFCNACTAHRYQDKRACGECYRNQGYFPMSTEARMPVSPKTSLAERMKEKSKLINFKTDQDLVSWYKGEISAISKLDLEGRIFQSWGLAEDVAYFLRSDHIPPNLKKKAQEYATHFDKMPLRLMLSNKVKQANFVLSNVASKEGWSVLRDSGGVTTFYRAGENGNLDFKVTGTVSSPLVNLVALINETNLLTTWFPFCKRADDIKSTTKFQKTTALTFKAFWPFSNRFLVLDTQGIDVSENGQALIISSSILDSKDAAIPAAPSDTVLMELQIGGFVIEPRSPTECEVGYFCRINLKMEQTPNYVVHWLGGKLFHFILLRMRKHGNFAKTPEYQKRIQSNAELYGYVQKRTEEFFHDRHPHALSSPSFNEKKVKEEKKEGSS